MVVRSTVLQSRPLCGGREEGQGSPGSERSGDSVGFRMGLILAKLWSLFGNEGEQIFRKNLSFI